MNLREMTPFKWLTRDEPMNRLWPDSLRSEMPLHSLQQQIDRMVDQAMRNIPSLPEWGDAMTQTLRPHLDIKEAANEYTISLEVPGVNKEDVNVEVRNDTIVISGEKKQESEKKDEKFHRVERSYGSFRRTLALPEDAKGDEIKASFKDGVLNLRIPRDKGASKEAKRITIQ